MTKDWLGTSPLPPRPIILFWSYLVMMTARVVMMGLGLSLITIDNVSGVDYSHDDRVDEDDNDEETSPLPM